MPDRLVVIGADAAGMSAASQARRMRGPDDLEIVAFERGLYSSFSACGIPYFLGGVVDEVDALVVRTPQQFKENQDIDVRIRHEVVELDLERRRVVVNDLTSGGRFDQPFDQLVVATGAKPIRPPLPGCEARGVFGLQVLDDGVAIKRYVDETSARRAVVVGAGYIGLEVAEALVRVGLEVTVVEMASQPMPSLDADMGALVADAMRALGIRVRTDALVTGFETRDDVVQAVVTGAEIFPADVVVLGLGARPNVDLAAEAGIGIGEAGGIAVDQTLRTDVPEVWAAGDCAEKMHRVTGRPVVVPLGTHANKEGRVAGVNIAGGSAAFPGIVGTAVTKVCDVEVGRTGIKENEAIAEGFNAASVVIDSRNRVSYYPGSQPLKIKLVFDFSSGRVLGAQIVGREGAAKRIDIVAMALWNEMTVDDLQYVDLGYAPPLSTTLDPVLVAARKAAEARTA